MRRFLSFVLLLLNVHPVQALTTVATVGDSFADAIYLAMYYRPDLLKKYDVRIQRWSRPMVGLARNDYFDYPEWLRATSALGVVDLCVIQVGSNDMQGIPAGAPGRWLAFGSARWKEVYSARLRGMMDTLRKQHCRQVVWILQPGFEKRQFMALHKDLINALQSDVVSGTPSAIFTLLTSRADYAGDNTHFNRSFALQLGPAMLRVVALTKQVLERICLSCHQGVAAQKAMAEQDILPLSVFQCGPFGDGCASRAGRLTAARGRVE
jgi:hypothetical protein